MASFDIDLTSLDNFLQDFSILFGQFLHFAYSLTTKTIRSREKEKKSSFAQSLTYAAAVAPVDDVSFLRLFWGRSDPHLI